MMHACANGKELCALALISKGANCERVAHSNFTSLLMAARHGHESRVRVLVEAGAGVDMLGPEQWT